MLTNVSRSKTVSLANLMHLYVRNEETYSPPSKSYQKYATLTELPCHNVPSFHKFPISSSGNFIIYMYRFLFFIIIVTLNLISLKKIELLNINSLQNFI